MIQKQRNEMQHPIASLETSSCHESLDAAVELQNPMVFAVQKPIEFSTVEFLKSMDSAAAVSAATSPAAMAVLADEFRHILLSHTIPVNSDRFCSSCSYNDSDESWYSQDSWTNSKFEENSIPIEAIDDLRCIAGRMTAAGYSRECVEAYATARKTVLNETFNKLGIEKLSSKTIVTLQREKWSAVDLKIPPWIQAAKFSFRVLFLEERRLSEQIFGNLGTDIDDACFVEAIKDFAINLFNFVQAISSSRRSPKKLFRILDLHQVLSDLLPDIRAIFTSKSGKFLREQAVELLSSLAEAVRETLSDFEKDVFGEPIKVPIPGGSIHPLTTYVMNYLHEMAGYKQKLEELIVSNPSTHDSGIDLVHLDYYFSDHMWQGDTTFERHLIWIIVSLKHNLEGKSKEYNDAALAYLFRMNNVHHITESLRRWSILPQILGGNCLNKLTIEYRMAQGFYQKKTWDRVLNCLKDNDLQNSRITISGVFNFKRGFRRKIKAFNAKFKEALTTQATWIVPNSQLQEELKSSIIEVLLPVYTSFLEKYRKHIPEDYIKYSPEDVEKAVMDLFVG